MLRGVDSSSALSPSQLTQVIITEGIRMSRKCSRLRPYLRAFGNFLIDFVTSLNNQEYSHMIAKRVHMAVSTAAADHYTRWRLTGDQLWARYTEKVRQLLMVNNVDPKRTELVSLVIGKHMLMQVDTPGPEAQLIPQDPTLQASPKEESINDNEDTPKDQPAKKRRRIDPNCPEPKGTSQNYITVKNPAMDDTVIEENKTNGTHVVSEDLIDDPFCSAVCDSETQEQKQFEVPNSENNTPY